MDATLLIRMISFWKALSRKVIYLIEDDNISWWFNVDYRLERQRNSEMIFNRKVGCRVQREGRVWEELKSNAGTESTT